MRLALRSLLCTSACWAALCATPVRAQQAPAQEAPAKETPAQTAPVVPAPAKKAPARLPSIDPDELPSPEDIGALRSNYRPSIHPGDPLHIVGEEQGDNDLRASTPMLAQGEHKPLQVDIEASYQRALAMYGDGTVFHTAIPPASKELPASKTPRQRPSVPDTAPKERGPEATPWSLLSGVIVSALLVVWFFVRVRPALIAPAESKLPEPEPFVWRPTRRVNAPRSVTHAEPSAPLPQRTSGLTNGARMAQQTKRR